MMITLLLKRAEETNVDVTTVEVVACVRVRACLSCHVTRARPGDKIGARVNKRTVYALIKQVAAYSTVVSFVSKLFLHHLHL